MKVGGLSGDDAPCRPEWVVGVNTIAIELGLIWPTSLVGDTAGFWTLVSLFPRVMS